MTARTEGPLPEVVDLIVLGSGAGGLAAALTASLEGLDCLLLEHRDKIGGTSALSSGTVWVPDNRAMRAAGHLDDRRAAESYLDALVGDRATRPIWLAFLDAATRMQADLEDRAGIALSPFRTAPDYRQDLPGAGQGWRPMEPAVFDGRRLGEDFPALASPIRELTLFGGMMIARAEAQRILGAPLAPASLAILARRTLRYGLDRLRWPRGTRLVMGNALVGRMLLAALDRGVHVRRAAVTRTILCVENRVSGVRVDTSDGPREIVARKGVVLAGGGFPASAEWRQREMPQPTPEYTPAADGCVGRTIELAQEVGAALGPAMQDNALWFPSSVGTRKDGTTAVWPHIVLDRAKPGSIIVDSTGRRFANEAVSYHEFVRAMYRANTGGTSIPAWIICDADFLWRYGIGMIRPRTLRLSRHIANGYLASAKTLDGLARRLGFPAGALEQTVAAFNGFAEAGRDMGFGRGDSVYDRSNGDPAHGPNPCLGPIRKAPFYAVKLHPTPLGSSRGLAADENARVLRQDGSPVSGLYVCGNDMQSAFGGEYPGAGAQLGQAMTFGWIAARHAAAASA